MKVVGIIGFFFLLCLAISAQQTSTILGRVFVDQTPVKATIVLKQEGREIRRTTADAAGKYRFDDLRNGNYQVGVEGMQDGGIAIIEEKTVAANGGPSVVPDFNLPAIKSTAQPELPIRETVIVSAGESQTIEQVSKTVDVINGQEMRDRADFSLVESLRTIPGFRIAQTGGFGRLATIKTRGLRNWDTAVLIDGIRFRDVTGISGDATAFLSDVTLTSVSKVEVLRGSGSSLYGTNAIGGTIDFQTPTARKGTHGQLGGAFGGLGLGRFRGTLSHGSENGRVGITSGLSRTVYTKGIDGDDHANNTNLQTRIDASPTRKTSISGRIFYSEADVRLNTDPDTFGTLPPANTTIIDARQGVNFTFDANDPDRKQRSRFFSGQLVVNQIVNDELHVGGYYQSLTTRRTNDNGPLGAGFQSASTSIYDGTVQTANVHFNWTPAPENTLTAGYEFESERFANDGKTPSGIGNYFTRAWQTSNTFYLQNLANLLEGRLQLAGGLRIQRFGLKRPEFGLANAPFSNLTLGDPPTAYTFDGAASYFFRASGTKLRAHIGNGYRVPSLYERFGTFYSSFGTPSFIAIGDPFLKPEKTIALDAGVEQNLAADRVRLSATYFYTRLNDIIGYGNVVPNIGSTTRPFGGYLNQKGGTSRGGEFSIKAKATTTTDIFTSYTLTNSEQRTPQISGNGIRRTLGVPDHQFTMVINQRIQRFWVNFDFLATSDYLAPIFSNSTFNTYVYRFGGNRKGDLTAGYTFGIKKEKMTLRIYGTIENVFNHEYFENGFRTPGATGRFGLTFGF